MMTRVNLIPQHLQIVVRVNTLLPHSNIKSFKKNNKY